MTNPVYVLGHSAFELERLARQERLIGPTTRSYFRQAGLVPGMRVLDVGSGTGLVAFHAAELVGESGEVIGTAWRRRPWRQPAKRPPRAGSGRSHSARVIPPR